MTILRGKGYYVILGLADEMKLLMLGLVRRIVRRCAPAVLRDFGRHFLKVVNSIPTDNYLAPNSFSIFLETYSFFPLLKH